MEAVRNFSTEDGFHHLLLHVLQVLELQRLFFLRAQIQAVYLVEDVHVRLVYLIFAVDLAERKHPDVFAGGQSLFYRP